MSDRYYQASVRAALAAFCSGYCYFPGCGQRLLYYIDGKWVIGLEIAHIYSLKDNGPRSRPNMPREDRNDFKNLIYLCTLHHKLVDANDGMDYSPETLLKWKRDNGSDEQIALHSKKPVTAEILERYINNAMAQREDAITEALDRLDQSGDRAAELIRELQAEIRALRAKGAVVDADTASMLSRAANKLTHLPESAELIQSAATKIDRSVKAASRLF